MVKKFQSIHLFENDSRKLVLGAAPPNEIISQCEIIAKTE